MEEREEQENVCFNLRRTPRTKTKSTRRTSTLRRTPRRKKKKKKKKRQKKRNFRLTSNQLFFPLVFPPRGQSAAGVNKNETDATTLGALSRAATRNEIDRTLRIRNISLLDLNTDDPRGTRDNIYRQSRKPAMNPSLCTGVRAV